ncbi:hypothetical protein [Microvirga antarctica]|uniref:hypothetical protein n=1 Tax=Microvirga antarctica TaxID=2819233 RepID=UPI001B30F195|nr:hypothetical protein [Microvirga antarctica]
MSVTILSAFYVSESEDTALLNTEELGAALADPLNQPDLWSDFEAWIETGGVPAPYQPPPRTIARKAFLLTLANLSKYDAFMAWKAGQLDETKIHFDEEPAFRENDLKLQQAVAALSVTMGEFFGGI